MYKRAVSLVLIAAAPFAASMGAQAQTAGSTGFYGGLGIGRASTDTPSAGFVGAKDEHSTAWKLFGGYQLNQHFALEGGYVDLGKASVHGGPPGIPPFGTLDSQAWQGSVVGSLPINQQFALTGKLGIARTNTDVFSNIGGTPFAATDKNTAATYGLGARYDLTKTVALRGEWERFRIGTTGLGGKSDVNMFSLNAIMKF